jgi:hypothetical protein
MDILILKRLAEWFHDYIGILEVQNLIPQNHPALMWLDQEDSEISKLETLVIVLANGGHLLLLTAIVYIARAKAIKGPPPDVDIALGMALQQIDEDLMKINDREKFVDSPDIFVCYAHEDSLRVDRICHALRSAGLSIFRDTESISPGSSIAFAVAKATAAARSAILVISKASTDSHWVECEIRHLMFRRSMNIFNIYPIVIDNVSIPKSIQDLFAIDLRDLKISTDITLIGQQLEPLIREIQTKEHK